MKEARWDARPRLNRLKQQPPFRWSDKTSLGELLVSRLFAVCTIVGGCWSWIENLGFSKCRNLESAHTHVGWLDVGSSVDTVSQTTKEELTMELSPSKQERDDEDAPRMVFMADPQPEPAAAPRQSESMSRRALNAVSGSLRRLSFGSTPASSGEDASRGSSISRFFSGSSGGEGERGSSLARIFVGEGGDLRGGSIGRIVFSEDSSGKLKAFRNVRKLASLFRKKVTGLSSSEASEALAAARRIQQVKSFVVVAEYCCLRHRDNSPPSRRSSHFPVFPLPLCTRRILPSRMFKAPQNQLITRPRRSD